MTSSDFALAKQIQDAICSGAQPIHAVAYPGDGRQDYEPFDAHVYLRGAEQVFVGTVWRQDRWPTASEIAAELARWRPGVAFDRPGVAFDVRWWQDPNVVPEGPHCVTCTCKRGNQ